MAAFAGYLSTGHWVRGRLCLRGRRGLSLALHRILEYRRRPAIAMDLRLAAGNRNIAGYIVPPIEQVNRSRNG